MVTMGTQVSQSLKRQKAAECESIENWDAKILKMDSEGFMLIPAGEAKKSLDNLKRISTS